MGQYPRGLGVCVSYGGSVRVCLLGRHGHGALVGGFNHYGQCELLKQWIFPNSRCGLIRCQPWGFFDMHGNLWEWTSDWYASYSSGAVTDPEGPATGSNRVFRGGFWGNAGPNLRSALRLSSNPSYRNSHLGFRVGFQQQ